MRHTYTMRWERRNRDNLKSRLSLMRIFSLFLPPPMAGRLPHLLLGVVKFTSTDKRTECLEDLESKESQSQSQIILM